jgi:SAM-dependent methyltransferase
MIPDTTHDEAALQDFVVTLRKHLAARVAPGARQVYEARVEPKFRAEHQRAPADRHEVRKLMTEDPYYQFWSAMQRRSQEMMWDSVIDTVERTLPEMLERSHALTDGNASRKGSLRLDPTLEIPRYHTATDIHLQPGGYHTDFTADDVASGVIYDMALPMYLAGALGPRNDLLGRILTGYLESHWADFEPGRILDMGCAIGNSTLAWAERYPDAELHAIDVGAPVLRYAAARAEALGHAVHYSQQNAEHTDFEDNTFDLVISHIMLHETSNKALPQILAECHRILKPGGLMLHLEIPRGGDAFDQFMYDWETYNNNETFAGFMTGIDLVGLAARAGFEQDATRVENFVYGMGSDQKNYSAGEFAWPILVARKAEAGTARRSA